MRYSFVRDTIALLLLLVTLSSCSSGSNGNNTAKASNDNISGQLVAREGEVTPSQQMSTGQN